MDNVRMQFEITPAANTEIEAMMAECGVATNESSSAVLLIS